MITRCPQNPLIAPADVPPSRADLEVMCAFNPGGCVFQGQTLLLLRVAERPRPEPGYVATPLLDLEHPGQYRILRLRRDDPEVAQDDPRCFTWRGQVYLTSISHLRLATSADGVHFTVAPRPTLMPTEPWEEFGIEDPRVTWLDGWFYVNYSAISPLGVSTALARTRDFQKFEKLGIIFPPDNKDIALFPEQIAGRYWCLHRPSMKQIGAPAIWISSSTDLLDWGRHRYVMGPRRGCWDAERVGGGASPIRTDAGWLAITHGANHQVRYCLGAVLLDLAEPWRLRARLDHELLFPEAPYEMTGLMPNVVFNNAAIDRGNGRVDLYYGAADTTVCLATLELAPLLAELTAGR